MSDLERRALLGDKQAQEELTRRGIVLECPFCGGSAELTVKDGLYSVACKDGTCIASDIHPEYGEAMVALADWNTRPAPPIGRCGECKPHKTMWSCSKSNPKPAKAYYATEMGILADMKAGCVFGETPEAATGALAKEATP